MINLTRRTLDALTLLFAPRGRHRAGHTPPDPVHPREARHALRRTPGHYAAHTPLDGAATPPVRPYVLTAEQRARQQAFWLASHGIDVGPRRIHGAEVG